MSKLLREVAYCHAKANESYARNDYASGEYYQNEVVSMVDEAILGGLITALQGMSLKRFGRI